MIIRSNGVAHCSAKRQADMFLTIRGQIDRGLNQLCVNSIIVGSAIIAQVTEELSSLKGNIIFGKLHLFRSIYALLTDVP